jgi:hypothetical protein
LLIYALRADGKRNTRAANALHGSMAAMIAQIDHSLKRYFEGLTANSEPG